MSEGTLRAVPHDEFSPSRDNPQTEAIHDRRTHDPEHRDGRKHDGHGRTGRKRPQLPDARTKRASRAVTELSTVRINPIWR